MDWPDYAVFRDYDQNSFTLCSDLDGYMCVYRLPTPLTGMLGKKIRVWTDASHAELHVRDTSGNIFYVGRFDNQQFDFIHELTSPCDEIAEFAFVFGTDMMGPFGYGTVYNIMFEAGGVQEFWTAYRGCREFAG